MGLEAGAFVSDLVTTNPAGGDDRSVGDDHLRLIKLLVKNTFPNADRAFYFPRGLHKTANYSVLNTNQNAFIDVDATAGAIAITLPSLGASDDGYEVVVVKVDDSANAVTIVGSISGATNWTLSKKNQPAHFWWSGTVWHGGLLARTVNGVATFTEFAVDTLLTVPVGTIAARPGAPTEGLVRANTTTSGLDLYVNGAWQVIQAALPRGHIDGAKLGNGADAVNDITISDGVFRDFTNTVDMIIPSMKEKQLDANWAPGGVPGTPVGGRFSGFGISDGTYHAYGARTLLSPIAEVFFYPGAAAVDAESSASYATVLAALQSQVGGAAYVYARRLGSFTRATSIRQFTQFGDDFLQNSTIISINNSAPGDTNEHTITVTGAPVGVILKVKLNLVMGSLGAAARASSLFQVAGAPVAGNGSGIDNWGANNFSATSGEFYTNLSAQFRYQLSADTPVSIGLELYSDRRGKDR